MIFFQRMTYCSLWKSTRRTKRTNLCTTNSLGRSLTRKIKLKCMHVIQILERVFQLNNIISELNKEQCQLLNGKHEKIKHFAPIEIAKEIDKY